MNALVYYISLPLLYLLSLLPMRVLYIISDGIYLLLYKVIGYRTRVVLNNLRNSFPEKSEAEIQSIAEKFYRYFCDLILETLKTLTISPTTLLKHVSFEDEIVFEKYYAARQSLIAVQGHHSNWELGGARFALEPYHQLFVIYHPLSNRYFDKLLYHMRTRLGNGLYSMTDALRGMLRDRDKLTITGFVADQTPSNQNAYWTKFLNQETAFFNGTEKIAKKLKYPVIYVSTRRLKRGFYRIKIEELAPRPEQMEEGAITELFARRLEKDIQEQPETWLWTHRRWKHKKKKIILSL